MINNNPDFKKSAHLDVFSSSRWSFVLLLWIHRVSIVSHTSVTSVTKFTLCSVWFSAAVAATKSWLTKAHTCVFLCIPRWTTSFSAPRNVVCSASKEDFDRKSVFVYFLEELRLQGQTDMRTFTLLAEQVLCDLHWAWRPGGVLITCWNHFQPLRVRKIHWEVQNFHLRLWMLDLGLYVWV